MQPAQIGVVIRNASTTMQGKTKRVVQKLSTLHVTKCTCGVKVYHHHQTALLCATYTVRECGCCA